MCELCIALEVVASFIKALHPCLSDAKAKNHAEHILAKMAHTSNPLKDSPYVVCDENLTLQYMVITAKETFTYIDK